MDNQNFYNGFTQNLEGAARFPLNEDENLQRVLFDKNPLPAFIFEPESLSILAANEAAAQSCGYSRSELVSMSFGSIFASKDSLTAFDAVGHIAATQRSKSGSISDVNILAHDVISNGRHAKLVFVQESRSNAARAGSKSAGESFSGSAEIERIKAESAVISNIIHGMSTTSNLEELLELIHRSIGEIIYAENCFVALYDEKTELLHMQFFVDKYDVLPPPVKLGRGLSAYIFRTGRSMLMTQAVMDELTQSGEVDLVGTNPAVWMGVPLQTPNGVIGVMVVQHYEDENAYSQRDLELLTSVGDQIALAIERKQAEDQLRLFNNRLQQSNRELQEFAYVASHDLQEPLRKVQAFSDRLAKKFGDNLGEEGLDYLERMRNAAHRMQTLIQDLLTFSRVTTKAQPFVQVNLETIAHEVLSDLEVKIEETGATVEVRDLPTIDADPLQMRQLIQNMVGNALKFRRPDTAPVIRLYAECSSGTKSNTDNSCRLFIEDNGIGFDEKYTSKIFTVFQRLHGRNEYEGSGVGLAVCRKIVERHNGSIDAKSKPGEGTTFIIKLPTTQVNQETNQ